MTCTKTITVCAAALVAIGLAGCDQPKNAPPAAAAPAPATPTAAEQACLAAVSRVANNGDVVPLGSEFSEAGTFVRVGVGPQRAPWKCIAYGDGTTAGVEFMGEG